MKSKFRIVGGNKIVQNFKSMHQSNSNKFLIVTKLQLSIVFQDPL